MRDRWEGGSFHELYISFCSAAIDSLRSLMDAHGMEGYRGVIRGQNRSLQPGDEETLRRGRRMPPRLQSERQHCGKACFRPISAGDVSPVDPSWRIEHSRDSSSQKETRTKRC